MKYLYGPQKLRIGRFTTIGPGITILMPGGNHPMAGPSTYPFTMFGGAWAEATMDTFLAIEQPGDTVIGNDVWIGRGATILPGVTIADGAVIGAGSVVAKDVGPYQVVAGNPARLVRTRYTDKEVRLLQAVCWWDWPIEAISRHAATIMGGSPRQLAELAPASERDRATLHPAERPDTAIPGPADIVILSGPPGAGKSTIARALTQRYPSAVHLHADDFWHFITSGDIPPYLPESDTQNQVVMDVIYAAASTYAAGSYTTIIDGIIGPWMLPHFLHPETEASGGRLHYIALRPGRTETPRRAQSRTAPDALIEEGPIVSLWDQFADIGALESHVIDSTTHTREDTLAAIVEAIDSGRYLLTIADGG